MVTKLLMYVPLLFAVIPPAICLSVQGRSASASGCNSMEHCEENGSLALKDGRLKEAVSSFRREVSYAEQSRSPLQMSRAYLNMALVHRASKDYLRAKVWIDLALKADPGASNAINGKLPPQDLRYSPLTKGTGGLYVRYAGMGVWDYVAFSNQSATSVHFELRANRVDTGSAEFGAASYGDVEGIIVLDKKDEVAYRGNDDYPDCHVTFSFKTSDLVVRQDGECGFGYGVDASGQYEKISEEANRLNGVQLGELP